MKNTSKKLTMGAAGIALAFGVVFAANFVASQTHLRVDLTRDRLYTLSSGTKELMAGLDRDVTLKFYFSRSTPGIPVRLKQYAQRIQDLLREYERLGGGKVTLEVLDPKPDSDEEEWAQRAGLEPQAFDPFGMSQVYLGLHIQSGSKESAVPFFTPQQEERLEYDITRKISEIVETQKPRIGLLSSLPVAGGPGDNPMMMMGRQRGSDPWAFYSELQNTYDIEQIQPMATEIPTNITTLLAIHPKELSDATLFALDQFVLRGGKLIAFVDPHCLADPAGQMGGMMGMGMGMSVASDLTKLTKGWGVEMDAQKVVSDGEAATRIRGMNGRPQRSTSWLSLRSVNMTRSEIAVGTLESLMMPFAGGFTVKPVEGVKADVLVQTSPGASLVSSMEATMGADLGGSPASEKTDKPYALAVRLSGKFKTAFPDGKPKGEGDAAGATNVVALKESAKDGAVVLVGDVDMLSDNYSIQKLEGFMGMSAYQLMNDNLNLLNNLVEQNSGSQILIGLRSRGSFRKPFDRVIALEDKAAQQWRDQEQKLQKELQDLQMKLGELQRSKNAEQQLVLSPEQRREIDKFRAQQTDISRQLKEVRKNLRQDIEALGSRLKILNIAAVPLLVAMFGVAFGAARRKKSTS